MGSFSHNCEIVEVKEELSSVQHSRKVMSTSVFRENDRNQKPLQNLGCSDSLEGLNKPFPVINLKHSYNLSPPQQVDSNPSRKNAQKMPITAESPHSLGMGVSDTVTLKQALRGLCITQASEMAAMKRLSKPPGISGVSDNLKNGHKSVLDEPFDDGLSLGEGRKNKVKISPLPEKSIPNHSKKTPQRLQVTLKTVHNRSAPSSPVATSRLKSLAKMPNVSVHASMDVGSPTLKSVLAEKEKTKLLHPRTALTISKTGSSAPCSPVATSKLKSVAKMPDTSVHASIDMGTPTLKSVLVEKGKIKPLHSPSCPKTGATTPKIGNSVSGTPKVPKKASTPGRLQNVSSSSSSTINKNKVKNSTSNTLGLTKPALKNTTSVNDKAKQDSASIASTSDKFDGISTELDLSKSHLICQRCQCALKNVKVDSDNESPVSNSPGAEVGATIVKSDASKPSFTSNKPTKAREKGQFFLSQKGSPGEYSSTTSFCGESVLSLPSCGNRPHMSKDEKWKAICHVRLRHEVLGLRHFNLLKKLGCGDIGTVYLAELIDSNCLFAIKVMDNAYLERRKKMLRAQTEREIMKILDHPFLPTLYGHFTSDNLSCLVMEFCPGGDLHVLRQRQLGRIFSEQAARFYAAEVLLALEYLHMLGVVYRDLKPENILVREDGHIMLTDFDLSLRCSVSPTLFKSSSSMDPTNTISAPRVGSSCAKPFFIEPSCQVPCFSPRLLTVAARVRKQKSEPAANILSLPQLVAEPTSARSNSFVGTHEYLAPEIINGEGHGSAVDWWTFGIFLYELLYGRTPFKGPGNEETLSNVVLMSLKFPDNPIVSVQARDLIRRLLMKDPGNRLGSQRGTAEIKRHPFFEGLNWALIRCAIPPEIPKDCNFGVPTIGPQQNGSKYLEYRATGDHLEFELF